MVKSAVYHKNSFIGEVDLIHKNNSNSISAVGSWIREIRISHFTPPSDRCPPLAVLHFLAATAAAATADGGAALSFKIESDSNSPELFSLYSSCIRDKKTAVATLGNEELHLVAMPTRKNLVQYSCFWGFVVAPGLYNSCLVMLNLRCLGIVFDLDETLIVANTTRSFEDRINTLQQKINTESDQQRVSGMMAEIKRYQDDKVILKQFLENDQVLDGGKVYKVQLEVVQSVSEGHQAITRPIIRLPEKNIILTRVNPAIRDTSVFVRLRPAWEDLKNYLIAKGRKRFEVYVCTLAERDYALEMWRLLDPQSNLINSKELLDRIVCVKPGIKKSLVNVFQNGICHPKMSLIIDDRWKVWDEKDQPRVHVVPAFAPYYAPQAEANNTIPVLCVARNVACNVRGYFFKEFDDGLLPHINATFYEDEMMDLPSAPDVGNYLISEDDTSLPNGTKDPIGFEGVADPEVERRLKDTNFSAQAFPPMINNFDPRTISSIQHVMPSSSGTVPLLPAQMMMSLPNNQFPQSVLTGSKPLPLGQPGLSEHSLLGSTTEEGEVPESDLDPNTRRRLLILQHGQDFRDPPSAPPPPPPPPPPFPFVAPLQGPVPPVQPQGSWLPLEEDLNPRQHNKASRQFPLEPEIGPFDRNRSQRPPYFRGRGTAFPSDRVLHENERLPNKVHYGDHRARMNRHVSRYNTYPGEETPKGQVSSNYRDAHIESGQPTARKYSESPAVVLQDIVVKSGGGKVEFRTIVCDTAELQFSVEVWLVEEKIGEGCAKTRKEAQQKAVMKAIENLAKKYMYPDQTAVQGDLNKENGFTSESNSFGYPAFERDDRLPFASSSDSLAMNHVMEGSKKSSSVSLLKDLCLTEGYNVAFFAPPAPLDGSASQGEVYAEVEIAGQIMGKGIGKTWEEAKLQAAEEAHESLKSMLGQFTQKRSGSPRTQSTMPNKRIKQDFSRVVQRIPSSGR